MISPRPEVLATPLAIHGGRSGTSGTLPATHDFSVCLNAYGPADIVARAVANAPLDEYPDPVSHAARAAAARRWNRPLDEILLGAGAAELIQAVCFAYIRPGDDVLVAEPAFGEYARAAALCGAHVRSASLCAAPSVVETFAGEIRRARPRLVFAATPISPTGDTLDIDSVQVIAEACRAADSLFVLDQAYDAFAVSPLGTPALPGESHVVHLRSLTKDHALAGVRAAFAVTAPPIATAIERARVPWSASAAAQSAAVAAMSDEATEHVARTTTLLRAEAARIAERCLRSGIDVHPTGTHFLLVGCESAPQAHATLLAHGLLVRDCTSFGLPRRIRVAARRPLENDLLIDALLLHLSPHSS